MPTTLLQYAKYLLPGAKMREWKWAAAKRQKYLDQQKKLEKLRKIRDQLMQGLALDKVQQPADSNRRLGPHAAAAQGRPNCPRGANRPPHGPAQRSRAPPLRGAAADVSTFQFHHAAHSPSKFV